MTVVTVGAAALNQTPLDWNGNQRNALEAIAAARSRGIGVLVLPELCLSGYGCEDAFLSADMRAECLELVPAVAAATRDMVVVIGVPLEIDGAVYDTAAIFADGALRGFVCKQNLARKGLHYEPRWFDPWPAGVVKEVEVNGQRVPAGDLIFACGPVVIGLEICEDAWTRDRPAPRLMDRGVNLIVNPSASHFAFGKLKKRQQLVRDGCDRDGVGYVYSNLLGNEAGRAIYDAGGIIGLAGDVVVTGRRFGFSSIELAAASLELRPPLHSDQARAGDDDHGLVTVAMTPLTPVAGGRIEPVPQASWESGPDVKEEEFARAIALGLFDYIRKSRSHGCIVSLSGGADSSAVAALMWLMARFAENDLGPAWGSRLIAGAETLTVAEILTCVYQTTENSSDATYDAARTLADALGATWHLFQVQDLVDRYVAIVEAAIGRPLTWQQDDIALQNIQARVRGPGVWMLANIGNALLLSTSNRSEAAVGYATMDGDTCGGLCPIAGIDKAFLLWWLRWIERTGPEGVGPVPGLGPVNQLTPTAELRPAEMAQTDEADLMPYDVLDAIERAAIRDKLGPARVLDRIVETFPEHDRDQHLLWVRRFFRLWSRNQWKRERYAPSLHVDDQNLDPKTWCRFPILSGGFERELAELT